MDTQKKGTDLQAKGDKPLPDSQIWPIGQIKSYIERKRRERQLEKPEERSGRITASATKAIAWFTAAMFLTSLLSWWEIHSGSDDTHKLAESTLSASRAWVVVEGTGFAFTKDKNFPTGRVVLADSGSSPAFGISGWRCVEVRTTEPEIRDKQLQKSPTAVCLPISGGTLGKGVPITMDTFIPSQTPPDFAQDTEGTGPHFYYWGIITYDIYPTDNKRHSTSFCLKNGGSQLSACSEGGYEAD